MILQQEPRPDDFETGYVTTNGVETHYFEAGDESGTPLVMVHGGGGGADAWGNWKFALPLLAERGFHVYAPDLIGFGKSEAPDPDDYPYDNQARIDQVAAFLDAIDPDAPHLLGNSMGGAASIGVAIQRPALLDTLILLGPAGATHPKEWPQETVETVKKLGGLGDSREDMHAVIDILSNADWYDREPMIDRRLENLSRDGVTEAHDATMAEVRKGDMYFDPEEFAEIDHETLVLHGKDDEIVAPDDAWKAFEMIDNASLELLNDCGHWVMVDRAEEASALVSTFIEHRG